MKVLSLNTQKAYQATFEVFMRKVLESNEYDFILLQEVTGSVTPLVQGYGSYKFLNAFNEDVQEQSHLHILYRSSYVLKESRLYSFSLMHPSPFLRHPGFGLLLGFFDTGNELIHIGSVHLHSGGRPSVRTKEALLLKEHLLAARENNEPMLFGGDFNLGLPGEVSRIMKILGPEFVSTTKGATLNSRYSEPLPNIINGSAAFFAKLGLGISLKADHLFIDSNTAARRKVEGRILPDRVSDHSPIELCI